MTRRLAALITASALAIALAACSAPAPTSPSASATASAHQAVASTFPDGVSAIECDIATHARHHDQAVPILGEGTWRLGGWSHVNGVGAFETVTRPIADYRITAENWLADNTCGGAKTLAVVLTKKFYDWDRQHANGMEAVISSDGLTFGEVTDIVIEFRFDAEDSRLPSHEELLATYGHLVTADDISALDDGSINLELTLYGAGATADAPFMNAGTIISVDPALASDGWVRVQVPREQLTFYTEENYARTEVGPDQWQELTVAGLRINPETSSGNVLRHTLGDAFDTTAAPETLKEMALFFGLIEVGRSA